MFPTAGGGSGLTDLVREFNRVSAQDNVLTAINDYLINQIQFTDRYFDDELIERIQKLAVDETETISVPEGVSYAAFQNKLADNGVDIVSVRDQLEDFLAGTGYQPRYEVVSHPDPSLAGNPNNNLYKLTEIRRVSMVGSQTIISELGFHGPRKGVHADRFAGRNSGLQGFDRRELGNRGAGRCATAVRVHPGHSRCFARRSRGHARDLHQRASTPDLL